MLLTLTGARHVSDIEATPHAKRVVWDQDVEPLFFLWVDL
jgi:hypothetical protein